MESGVIHGDRRKRRGDRRVVAAGVQKGLPRQIEAELARRAAGAIELLEHRAVIDGRDDDQHILKILRGGANKARTPDIDLLDQGVEWRLRIGRGFDEWIKVDHNHIDQCDGVISGGRQVVGAPATRQDAPMHQRMKRLDAAVHHFWKSGDVGDPDNGEAGLR